MSKKFTIIDAQRRLDERNGHFDILDYKGMRAKSLVRCRRCDSLYWISTDSLIRYKTDKHFGCVNCNQEDSNKKLADNKLRKITRNPDGTTKVQCLQCDTIFDGFMSHFVDPKFICQHCGFEARRMKILEHPELYKQRTVEEVRKQSFISYRINEGSLMWFYILGLLFSDGHFTYNTGRITFALKKADINTVLAVADFLHCKVKTDKLNAYIDICSPDVRKLMAEYKITDRKTYEPCDISSIDGDEMIAFIIGFIDGDGCIGRRTDTNQPRITIKLHESWIDNLRIMSECLYLHFGMNDYPKPIFVKQKSKKYAQVTWCNTQVLKQLSNFSQNNGIPVMKRKWIKIEDMEER